MADIEEQQPEPEQPSDEHPTALIGRGDSVLVKELPTGGEDYENDIALIKESEVRHHYLHFSHPPTNSNTATHSFTCTN